MFNSRFRIAVLLLYILGASYSMLPIFSDCMNNYFDISDRQCGYPFHDFRAWPQSPHGILNEHSVAWASRIDRTALTADIVIWLTPLIGGLWLLRRRNTSRAT